MINSIWTLVILIPTFLWAVTLFSWPDIPPVVFNVLNQFASVAYVMNQYIAVDTLFTFAKYIVYIEIGVWITKKLANIYFSHSQTNLTDDL